MLGGPFKYLKHVRQVHRKFSRGLWKKVSAQKMGFCQNIPTRFWASFFQNLNFFHISWRIIRLVCRVVTILLLTPEVRSHALRALTNVIYDRRSLKVLTIYDPRYTENASTVYDLRSLPFLVFRDLRSMTFNFTIHDRSPFVRFTIYGSRDSIHGLRSTIDDLQFASSNKKQSV